MPYRIQESVTERKLEYEEAVVNHLSCANFMKMYDRESTLLELLFGPRKGPA